MPEKNHVDIVVAGTVAYDTIENLHGKREHVLGGSATYFAFASRLFASVGLIAVVGEDFSPEDETKLRNAGIDLSGLQKIPGKTFAWHGRYSDDLAEAYTIATHLNVLEKFEPQVPDTYQNAQILFLANLDPRHQLTVLESFHKRPRLVVADTMNFWIEHAPDDLKKVLQQIDILIINEGEARLLSGEHNIVRASRNIRKMGDFVLVIKRGGYGAILFRDDEIFALPSYPLEEVIDTTGAGDSFAGGMLGSLSYEPTRWRKALIMGNLVASFTVEEFSIEKLAAINYFNVIERYHVYRDIVRLDDY